MSKVGVMYQWQISPRRIRQATGIKQQANCTAQLGLPLVHLPGFGVASRMLRGG
jgi:hypothetical protein